MQKHRISTDIGKDQFIKVELKQEFDLLEILSLKFTQKEAYASYCSDYGVVCGRISVNNGFGVPNARVSIFIPINDSDIDDPVISALYPYQSVTDRNENNYRYNLLPSRQQHGGHTPTGTFPDQSDILTREEVLEVYEKYYKYTVKTNDSGDFMIWGVPLGLQTIHIDVDLSDIGCFSLRPYDFIRLGIGEDQFKNTYTFKSSDDIDSLPQIVSFDKTIEVFPFWGNESICEIGVTRTDFDLSSIGVKIEPKAYLIGGVYTDNDKNSINKNCAPRRKMGRKCDLETKTGKVEAIRFSHRKDEFNRPYLEQYNIDEDIPDDGGFLIPVPMNREFIFTNEFGENEITNDPNKGIATSACYRFKFSLDDSGNERVRKTASYLVPNIREYQTNSQEKEKSYSFSTDWNDYPTDAITIPADPYKGILYVEGNQYFPKDYFYRMTYNKVYTVSSFQNIYYKNSDFKNDRYIGIKEIVPTEEEDCSSSVVTPPVNYATKNSTFAILTSEVLLFLEHLLNLVVMTFTNMLVRLLFTIGDAADFRPIRRLARSIKKAAFRAQENGQKKLYLITYPDCEECNNENENGTEINTIDSTLYCKVGDLIFTGNENNDLISVTSINFYATTEDNCPGENIDELGANEGISGIAYFIKNQSIYQLDYEGNLIHLIDEFTGDPIYNDYGEIINYINIKFKDTYQTFINPYEYNVVIRSKTAQPLSPSSGLIPEEGCKLYDVPYDEDIIAWYYIEPNRTRLSKTAYTSNTNIIASNITNTGYNDSLSRYTSTLSDDIYYYKSSGVPLVSNWEGENHDKMTPSGQSEFQDGVFIFVPGTQNTKRVYEILKEYRRRKRVGKLFCGGIVNYSFIDNWLSGSLYFFKFKGKKGKYCKDVIYYSTEQESFYYRSAIYTNETSWGTFDWAGEKNHPTKMIGRPTTMVDLGPRDEFIKEICTDPTLDPNCSVARSIGPTSFQSFGEILGLAINYRMDISNNTFGINQFFDNTGFKFPNQKVFDGDILQLISINNEVGIEEFDLQSPRYFGYQYEQLDPELNQDIFKNGTNVYGPLPITFYLDDDGDRVRLCLNEPTHKDYDGTIIQGRLTESSQRVPFFLWDKKGTGFGPYVENNVDNQSWDYNSVQIQPLQGMTYGYLLTGSNDDSSDKYLLLPMTYTNTGKTGNSTNGTDDIDFDDIGYDSSNPNWYKEKHDKKYPGYTVLSVTLGTLDDPVTGILYTRYGSGGTWASQPWSRDTDYFIRRTQDYYDGNKQILSTPFLFYFGLRPGNTGVDKLITYFGPKGAFPPAE